MCVSPPSASSLRPKPAPKNNWTSAIESILLSLGSNVGDKVANLKSAIDQLGRFVEIQKISSFYKSSPVEDLDQDWFVNLCLSGRTTREPRELLAAFKQIEKDMGSAKERPKGPRLIDIDIVFYGKRLVNEEPLRIPHPSYRERLFVLHPLLEIEPGALDPEFSRPVREYLSKVPAGQDLEKMNL